MTNATKTEKTRKLMEAIADPPKPDPAWKLMRDWSDLTRELELPLDLHAAISTRRNELLAPLRERLITDRDACNDYALPLLHCVELLIETNEALQQHAAQVAERAGHIEGNLYALQTGIAKMRTLAEFQDPESATDDDGEWPREMNREPYTK